MDRFWLAILMTCALIGAAMPFDALHEYAGNSDEVLRRAAVAATEEKHSLPSVSSDRLHDADPGAEEATADDEAVEQILVRFAIRHTGLAQRERLTLARAIVREARVQRLDPDLVMAVIEVESAGYHLAQSHVGALGLMQLLPSTGKELAGKLDIEWMGPHTLFDPIINIRLGTAYLRELADRYDGNVETALAAYNWGPGRIDRRIRRGATVPSIYIQQVLTAADRYAAVIPTRS